MKREIDAFLDRLAGFQFRHAGVVLFVSVLLAAGSLPLVMQLGLDSAFVALLPETKPSVQDLREVEDRVGGLQTLTVAIQSKDLDAMQRFTKELVPRLEKDLDPEIVRSVDWNIGTYEDFVYEHRHLYADIDDLLDARDDLEERIDFEKLKDNPFYVRLDDHEPPEIQTTIDRIKKKADEGKEEIAKYPGGYYVHSDNDLLVVFVRSNLKGGDAAGAARLIAQIDEHVHDLGTSNYAPDLVVEYAGSLVIIREEHEALAREMVLAVSITIALVLLAIYIFFRRIRAPFLLGGAMVTPVLMSFATGELTVDYLNTSTVFLGSIVIGNGVNPNIIWLARYFEERRRGREVLDSLERAHHGTWVATLTASAAAGLAYGSLIITDFRGFADFGIIGGAGMILCWFGAYFILPALTALVERIKPLTYTEKEKNRKPLYGLLFARMVYARPKLIVALSALLGAVVITAAGYAIIIKWDPLEYNFKNLKSVREGSTRAKAINDRVGDIVGSTEQGNAIVMVAAQREQARAYTQELERRRDEEKAPWADVQSIDTFLPEDQPDKIPILDEIRTLLEDVREYANEDQLKQIDEHIPPKDLRPLGDADLPEEVARPYTEKDGTRGRIILVEKAPGYSIWDGRYLVAWAKALRNVKVEDWGRLPLTGRAPVFADIIEAIWTDGPKAIAASFTATLLLVLVSFRRTRERLLTMMALLLGILWMGGLMAAVGMRLNFLNFVAFPITFGNGVDYGVNVMRRYALETDAGHSGAVRSSIEETGGAVILCSLTTIIGYTTLYTSSNLALNSFGLAMSISEITCVASAVLTMPALLLLLERRSKKA